MFSITPYFDDYTDEAEDPVKEEKDISVPETGEVKTIYFNTKYTGSNMFSLISKLKYTDGYYTLYYNKDNQDIIQIKYGQDSTKINENNPYGYVGEIYFNLSCI